MEGHGEGSGYRERAASAARALRQWTQRRRAFRGLVRPRVVEGATSDGQLTGFAEARAILAGHDATGPKNGAMIFRNGLHECSQTAGVEGRYLMNASEYVEICDPGGSQKGGESLTSRIVNPDEIARSEEH